MAIIFGRFYLPVIFCHFWPTVLSVEPLVHCFVCLSVAICLSVCRLSVTFCIVAKRYVLAKKCLKELIGNQGQKVHFFGRRHISTSGFAATAPKTAVFALCIVAKRYVLAKSCLKERIGNQGQKADFLGRRHISTSGFAATATETAVFALFLLVQPSNRY